MNINRGRISVGMKVIPSDVLEVMSGINLNIFYTVDFLTNIAIEHISLC